MDIRLTDVAVHEPGTRVVRLEGDDQVATLTVGRVVGHDSRVPAGRVYQVERDAVVVETCALGEDVKVVTVQMHGVRERDSAVNDNVDPLAELGNFNGEVARVVGDAAVLTDRPESWLAKLGAEGGAA